MATSEEKRVHRVEKSLANPVYFAELYVRPYDNSWQTQVPMFGGEMLRFALVHKRGVVMLPPEYLKTTLLSQVLPLWLTFRSVVLGTLLRGMLASEEQGLAEANLAVISWHIENNEYLLADFVDRTGRPLIFPDPEEDIWRSDAIVVNRPGTHKDPTWQAKGLDSKGIHGKRLDWLIADDLITPKNSDSPTWRERAIDYWDLMFTSRLVYGGHGIICGNFNDPRDLLSTLALRDSYGLFKRPGIHKKGKPEESAELGDPDATPLWPENWSLERLAGQRKEKPNRFRRIFLLDKTAESGERLKVPWVTVIPPEETNLKEARFYFGIDPAPGGTTHDLDYFNLSIGAYDGATLDLIVSLDMRCDSAAQVELVGMFHDRYQRLGQGVIAIGCGAVALDHYFRGVLNVGRPELSPKVESISIAGPKDERLEALGPFAKSGFMRVWQTVWDERTSNQEDQKQELTLHEQWKGFPGITHNDKLDGLDVLIRTTTEFAIVGGREFELGVAGE